MRKTIRSLRNATRFNSYSNDHYFKPTDEDLEKNPDCIICRDANDKETSRVIPCGHVLHEECLKSWILQKDKCPLCNHSLFDFDKEAESKKSKEKSPLDKALEDPQVQQAIRSIQYINMHNVVKLFDYMGLDDEEMEPFFYDLSVGNVISSMYGGNKYCYMYPEPSVPLKDSPWISRCDSM